MSPVFKVFIATTIVGVMLYFGIDKFLGGTEKLAATLDVRSLAYLRDDSASKGKKDDVEALSVEVQEPAEEAPERTGESVALDPLEVADPDNELLTEETEEGVDSEEDLESEEDTDSEEGAEGDEKSELDEESDEDDSDERGESVELDGEPVDGEETDESGEAVKAESSEQATGEVGDAEDSEKVAGETDETAAAKESSNAEKPAEIEETPAEARARELKEKLGIKVPKPPTRAVDVLLVPSEGCEASGVALAPVSVAYRFESPTVKGASLQQLELLVAEYRRCPDSVFQLTENSTGSEDSSETLTQMRFDELKYFFIQHSVSKTALRYPKQP